MQESSKQISVLRPNGSIDANSVDQFSSQMAELDPANLQCVLVDFSDVTFIASIGLRAIFVQARKFSGTSCGLRFFGLAGIVRETFEVSGFSRFIEIFENEDQAREGL